MSVVRFDCEKLKALGWRIVALRPRAVRDSMVAMKQEISGG
jgi:hypothetical protein